MVFKANKVKAGMAKAPHSVTVPLYGRQIYVIRDVSELKIELGRYSAGEKRPRFPLASFFPKGARGT